MATHVVAGTPDARAEHVPSLSAVGMAVGYAIPAVVAIGGLAAYGWGAISWGAAIMWGLVGALLMWLSMVMGRAMNVTRINFMDMLGSMFVEPHSPTSTRVGLAMHEVDGALLGIAGAYGALLVGWELNWASGLVWGVVLWALSLLVLTSVGGVHPAMRRGQEEDPGTAGMNMGPMTAVGSLAGHLVYGLVLGLGYQAWMG